MGGQAVKEFNPVRYNKEEYFKAMNTIHQGIVNSKTISEKDKIAFVKSYHTKDSYGDIDIIGAIERDKFESLLREIPGLKIIGKKVNHNITSYCVEFEFSKSRVYQLDYIVAGRDNFDFSYNYLNYNDLGSLIGRMANSYNLKFGMDGLFVREWFDINGKPVPKNHKYAVCKKEKKINLNFYESLKMLDLDPLIYEISGFDTLDDIFSFVSSSRFFHTHQFNFKYLNSEQRARSKKRPNYMLALDYFNKKEDKKSLKELKAEFEQMIKMFYPQIINARQMLKKEAKREALLAKRITIDKVKEILVYGYGMDEKNISIKLLGRITGELRKIHDRDKILTLNNKEWKLYLRFLIDDMDFSTWN